MTVRKSPRQERIIPIYVITERIEFTSSFVAQS